MFTKSIRFRGIAYNSTEATPKTSSSAQREAKGSIKEDDTQSGSLPAKKMGSNESEQVQLMKRPSSRERRAALPERKKSGKRELKRTNSYIPRATSLRSKTPLANESKKPVRKSETSLKTKESMEDNKSREKKYEPVKIAKTANPEERKINEVEVKKMPGGRDPEIPGKMQSLTKVTGRCPPPQSKGGHMEGRVSERAESKQSQGNAVTDDTTVKSLEHQYIAKKNAYGALIKDFREKQKAIRDHYNILLELRRKISFSSSKNLQPEELIHIPEVDPPFVVDRDQKRNEKGENKNIITFESKIFSDIRPDFTEFHNTFEISLTQSREVWLHLLPTIVNSRKEILAQLREINFDMGRTDTDEDEKSLDLAIENAKYFSKSKIENVISETKKLYANRETIKHELKTVMDKDKITGLVNKDYKEIVARLKQLDDDLKKEKVRTEDLMEKRALLEKTNLADSEKIETMERTISEQQSQILQLNFQLKSLKQKEIICGRIGGKSKDLKDLKELKAKADLLRAMQDNVTELTNDFNAQKKILQKKTEELEQSLKEKEEELATEMRNRQAVEASLAEAEGKLQIVREKKKEFAEVVDKTKQMLQTNNSGPSKREEELWTNLEASKILIKGYKDQVNKLTEEKSKLLLKFQTICEDESNRNTERLAADLVGKEEIIRSLTEEVSQLQTNCEEQSAKYNTLLAQVKEIHERTNGKTDITALSKQLGDIKMQKKELQEVVKELASHNQELETALVQRSLELDQRNRLVKQQCNLLKMRDELTELVRSKDDTQYQGVKKALEHSSRWEKKAEKIYKDMEKKANELDDMYNVLVEKQKQVDKLNKLVKIMEDQQNKAQEQRVRLESKISELQEQLAEDKNRRVKASLL